MAEGRIEIDTGTGELLCEIRDRVALITLNRPESRNALSDHLTPALRRMSTEPGAAQPRADGAKEVQRMFLISKPTPS
jgi:enoyl-CoA hydratase/carnithine racemase